MDRIPGLIPYLLGGSSAPPPVTSGTTITYDVSIGGIPFTANWTPNTPFDRSSAPIKKDQFDTAPDAGEQTLDFWWLRSQSSWHAGAGQTWFEPAQESDDKFARIRFDASFNMDVWTPGQLSRLPDTKTSVAFTDRAAAVLVADAAANSYVAVAHGNKLEGVRLGEPDVNVTYNWGGSSAIMSACTDGLNYYLTDGSIIYKGPLAEPTTNGVKAWTVPGSSSSVKLGWVKQRLVCCVDNKVYEVIEAADSTAPPTLATIRYTHPSADWRWDDFADGPSGVLIAGHAGSNSSIYQFGLADDDPPVMGGASPIATLPVGEQVTSLTTYIGSFLGIGTTAGVRVGTFDPYYGSLTYGPLSYESTGPVLGLTGKKSYLYAAVTNGIEGESGLVRLDLGFPTDSAGRVAWANDLVGNTPVQGDCTHVQPVQLGKRMVFCVEGTGMLIERVPGFFTAGRPGWLRTSRIRFSTVEPKFFRFASLRGVTEPGELEVFATFTGDSEVSVLDRNHLSAPDDFKLNDAPREWVSLRLELSGDSARDMQLNSFQIKAVPAVQHQELIMVPVNVFDSEEDRFDNAIGHPGWAIERFRALKLIENSGVETTLSIDLGNGKSDDYRCYIDKIEFQQTVNPNRVNTFGGLAAITVRTIS